MSLRWLRAAAVGAREFALCPLNAQSLGSWRELQVLGQLYAEYVNRSLSGGLKDTPAEQRNPSSVLFTPLPFKI